jgi:hypothetical protein
MIGAAPDRQLESSRRRTQAASVKVDRKELWRLAAQN